MLFEKYGLPADAFDPYRVNAAEQAVRASIQGASEDQVMNLLDEVIRTRRDLRSRIDPRYRYDERWEDLIKCLQLDGYRVERRRLIPADPTIPDAAPVDDDLSSELKLSGLAESDQIVTLMENSADAFRKVPPDYNGSLANARVAIETLARAIANARLSTHPGSFDASKWGQTLAYLKTSEFLSSNQEQGIAGVYSLVSHGAHVPVGLTEEGMVRLGRSLVALACFFLIKLYNGSR
jgi:hypothetical protein